MFRFVLVPLVLGVIFAACGDGGDGETTASPTAGPSRTAGPTVTAPPTVEPTLPPITGRIEIAGVTLFPQDEWTEGGRSACASTNPEAPYLGPIVFSIRNEELPELEFPGHEMTGVRVCKHAGVTSLAYIFDTGIVMLAAGPTEWPVRAAREQISEGEINGRAAVFIEPAGEIHIRGAQVMMATEFGLVFAGLDTTLEDAKAVVSSIDVETISVPPGKPSFVGTLNGIRLYSNLEGENRREGCQWDQYGVRDPDADGVEVPEGSPLDVPPSYLPEGYSEVRKSATDCGGGVDLVEVYHMNAMTGNQVTIYRASGEAAWYSPYSEDWLAAGTVDGLPAVFIEPPWEDPVYEEAAAVVVKEGFGITVVHAPSLEEAVLIAEGLNR